MKGVFLALALSLISACCAHTTPPSQTQENVQWEYIFVAATDVHQLDALGARGWEAVSSTPMASEGGVSLLTLLKRRLLPSSPPSGTSGFSVVPPAPEAPAVPQDFLHEIDSEKDGRPGGTRTHDLTLIRR